MKETTAEGQIGFWLWNPMKEYHWFRRIVGDDKIDYKVRCEEIEVKILSAASLYENGEDNYLDWPRYVWHNKEEFRKGWTERSAKDQVGFFLYNPYDKKHFFRIYDGARKSHTFKDYQIAIEDIKVELLSNFNSLYTAEKDDEKNHLNYSSRVLGKTQAIRDEPVLPGEEEIEQRWRETKGLDENGKAWLTPRMMRVAEKLKVTWSVQGDSGKK